jgi:hypothetical protein
MQVSPHKTSLNLVGAIAPASNLFLLLILPELRKQGVTFLAFYALNRIIESSALPEYAIRIETGLPDYEVSRACRLLVKGDLVTMIKTSSDGRMRWLKPTSRGERFRDKVLSAAALRLQQGTQAAARRRRFSEAAGYFRQGNEILHGPLQISFFDRHDAEEPWEQALKKRLAPRSPGDRSKRSKG